VRRDLYDRLVAIAGPLSTEKLTGFPAFPVTRLNSPEVADRLVEFLKHIRTLAGAGQ
jgi:hypothetical protein